ncbi:MAG: vanadium-dependent haloperoxidase [Ktedonobacteraceae bacterium]|nr:vanadium-dependent haloperoxidase [Ktedonobacteraceae bacterium]
MSSEKRQSFSDASTGEETAGQALSYNGTSASSQKKLVRRTVLQAGMRLTAVAAAVGIGAQLEMHPGFAFVQTSSSLLKPDPTDTVVVQWNSVALQAISDVGFGPTIGARVLAIVHTSMYDAWTAYNNIAVATQQNGIAKFKGLPSLKNIDISVSYAAYRALMDLFPSSEAPVFNALMQTLNLDPTNMSTDTTTPVGIGNVAAQAVITYCHSDGSNQPGNYADTTGYSPVNTPTTIVDPDRWQPLQLPNGTIQKFLTPHWGTVKPFALTSGSQFRPDGPAVVTQARYKKQVDVILQLSAALNDTSKSIAEYWADGPHTETPPGHWDLFSQFVEARFVSRTLRRDTIVDIKLFFALTNAIFDASIACWDCKRFFDSVRPVTAVHYLYSGQQISAWVGPGQGTQSIDGSAWRSYIATPPFAEYVSGHSTFSAAGAHILASVVGNDDFNDSFTVPVGSSLIEPGITPSNPVTLSWPTFSSAAIQAGMSRQYGGIHFNQADVDGLALGRKVAVQARAKALAYIRGNV